MTDGRKILGSSPRGSIAVDAQQLRRSYDTFKNQDTSYVVSGYLKKNLLSPDRPTSSDVRFVRGMMRPRRWIEIESQLIIESVLADYKQANHCLTSGANTDIAESITGYQK